MYCRYAVALGFSNFIYLLPHVRERYVLSHTSFNICTLPHVIYEKFSMHKWRWLWQALEVYESERANARQRPLIGSAHVSPKTYPLLKCNGKLNPPLLYWSRIGIKRSCQPEKGYAQIMPQARRGSEYLSEAILVVLNTVK